MTSTQQHQPHSHAYAQQHQPSPYQHQHHPYPATPATAATPAPRGPSDSLNSSFYRTQDASAPYSSTFSASFSSTSHPPPASSASSATAAAAAPPLHSNYPTHSPTMLHHPNPMHTPHTRGHHQHHPHPSNSPMPSPLDFSAGASAAAASFASTVPDTSGAVAASAARLHSAASTLLSHLTVASADPSITALARDDTTRPYLIDRLTELLTEAMTNDREHALERMREEAERREHDLAILRNEHASAASAAHSKHMLLEERAALLADELRQYRAAAENESSSLTNDLIPRLQSQLNSLQSALTHESSLSESLSHELKQRDTALESISSKYTSVSDSYVSLQSVVQNMNERLVEQARENERLKEIVQTRGSELHHVRSSVHSTSTSNQNEWQSKYDTMKAQHALELQSSISQTREHSMTLQNQVTDLTRQLQEMRQRVENVKEEKEQKERDVSRATETKIHDTLQQAAKREELLTQQLSHAQQAMRDREAAKEKQHALEIQLRTDEFDRIRRDYQNKLETQQINMQALQDQITSLQADNERATHSLNLDQSEMYQTLSRTRDELIKYKHSYETLQAENDASKQTHSAMIKQFEKTLSEDEVKITKLVDTHSQKLNELKRRWGEDITTLKKDLKVRDDELREVRDEKNELERQIKLSADTQQLASRREEEQKMKLSEMQIAHSTNTLQLTHQLSELTDKYDTLLSLHRDAEKSIDRLSLEKETESKRFTSELEMRLIQQKQAFLLERMAMEKDLSAARSACDTIKIQHDAELSKVRVRFEEEKQRAIQEERVKMDKKIEEIKSTLPSQEKFDAQVRAAVEEATVQLNKTYLSPDTHASVVAAKLDQQKFEHTRAIHAQQVEYDAKLQEVQKLSEVKTQNQLNELRLKYETEYQATMAQVREGCREYEEELEKERRLRLAAEEKQYSAEKTAQSTLEQANEIKQVLSDTEQDRAALQEQLQGSAHMIEKLRNTMTSEKMLMETRLAEEQKRHTEHLAALEASHVVTAQSSSAAVESAKELTRVKHEAEKTELKQSLERRMNEECTKLAQQLTEARKKQSEDATRMKELQRAIDLLQREVKQERDSSASKLDRLSADSHHLTEEDRKLFAKLREEEKKEHERVVQKERAQHLVDRQAYVARLEALQAEHSALEKKTEQTVQHVGELQHTLSTSKEEHTTTQSQLTTAHHALHSVRIVQSHLVQQLNALREEHSSLQVAIRDDLTSLYGVSTHTLSQMHSLVHQQQRRLFVLEEELRATQLSAEQLSEALREREAEMRDLEERLTEQMNAQREEHLLELALVKSRSTDTADIESLNRQIEDLQQNHSQQLDRLRKEYDLEYQHQLEHMEELLKMRTGTYRDKDQQEESLNSSFSPSGTLGQVVDDQASFRVSEGNQQQQQYAASSNPGAASQSYSQLHSRAASSSRPFTHVNPPSSSPYRPGPGDPSFVASSASRSLSPLPSSSPLASPTASSSGTQDQITASLRALHSRASSELGTSLSAGQLDASASRSSQEPTYASTSSITSHLRTAQSNTKSSELK